MSFIGYIKGQHATQKAAICKYIKNNTGINIKFLYENTLRRLNIEQINLLIDIINKKDLTHLTDDPIRNYQLSTLVSHRLIQLIDGKYSLHPKVLWKPKSKFDSSKYQGRYNSSNLNNNW